MKTSNFYLMAALAGLGYAAWSMSSKKDDAVAAANLIPIQPGETWRTEIMNADGKPFIAGAEDVIKTGMTNEASDVVSISPNAVRTIMTVTLRYKLPRGIKLNDTSAGQLRIISATKV